MTNEEAKETLLCLFDSVDVEGVIDTHIWYKGIQDNIKEALSMGIKALEPKTGHGRLIDADDLISVLDILCDKGGDIRYWEQLKWIVADCPTIIEGDTK